MHFCIAWVIFQQFSRRDVKLVAFLIIFHLLRYTSLLIPKFHGKIKQKLAYYEVESMPKNEFSLYLITFHSNVSHFVVSLLSIKVTFRVATTQESFFRSKTFMSTFCLRLRLWIKHRFVGCISFWRIQNRYKEMDVIRSLFNRCNACNWHRVTHDYGGWRRLLMVLIQRDAV